MNIASHTRRARLVTITLMVGVVLALAGVPRAQAASLQAVDDSYSTAVDTTLIVPAPNVLANDIFPPDHEIAVETLGCDYCGPFGFNGDGSFEYSPERGFSGTAHVYYQLFDLTTGESTTGTITITVGATNQPLVAVDDSYSTAVDTMLSVPAPGLLANDMFPPDHEVVPELDNCYNCSQVSIYADGSFEYYPSVGFSGTDYIYYSLFDLTTGERALGTVTITVVATNQAPVAVDDSYSTGVGTPLSIAAPGVLGNDTDADGDPLTAVPVSTPAHGTLTLDASGALTYTPASGYVGSDSFTYKANDGQADSNVATVSVAVTYAFTGFFSPVDNLPTLNEVKAGSGIPVKFSLGGNQGLNILAAGYPVSQQVNCSSTAPIDAVEETTTANQGLTYDAGANQYNYVWKTQKSWAGTCRQFTLRLSDGSDHLALFKFK
jgi:hypothetical protein